MEDKLIKLVYSQAPDVNKKHMQRNLQGSVAREHCKHYSFLPSFLTDISAAEMYNFFLKSIQNFTPLL